MKNRIWNQPNTWKLWVVIVILVPASWALWAAIMIAVSMIFDLSIYPETSEILTLMQTGFIWMPIIAGLIARDRWVMKQMCKHIDGAMCKECEYRIVGLEINKSSDAEFVLCPECGAKNELSSDLLTEADLNPTLLTNS